MPTVLRVGPYRFFFYSNEGNEPPHIHVEAGEKLAKFWLQPVNLASTMGYNGSEIRQIEGLVRHHHKTLIKAWRKHFGH
jgi:hypothetical protein